MKVSVIIPFYNEEEYLGECLDSLGKQSYDNFELILVDDGSTDNSKVKAQKSKLKNQNLKILEQDHKGPGAGRNLGASQAKGETLVFVDADMTFDKDFLQNLIEPIENGEARGTFSKQEYVSNWDNVWARCWNIEQGWPEKMRHPEDYPDKQRVFRAILKGEFDKVGGFSPGGYTDDYSLSEKLGYGAVNAPKAKFYHRNPESLKEVFSQAMWSAKRKYKLGTLGYLIAIIRSSLPVSLVLGVLRGVRFQEPAYLLFKVVYDLGVVTGILNYLITGRGAK